MTFAKATPAPEQDDLQPLVMTLPPLVRIVQSLETVPRLLPMTCPPPEKCLLSYVLCSGFEQMGASPQRLRPPQVCRYHPLPCIYYCLHAFSILLGYVVLWRRYLHVMSVW